MRLLTKLRQFFLYENFSTFRALRSSGSCCVRENKFFACLLTWNCRGLCRENIYSQMVPYIQEHNIDVTYDYFGKELGRKGGEGGRASNRNCRCALSHAPTFLLWPFLMATTNSHWLTLIAWTDMKWCDFELSWSHLNGNTRCKVFTPMCDTSKTNRYMRIWPMFV